MDLCRKAVTRLLLAALIAVTLAACGGSSDGEQLLQDRCQKCHTLSRIEEASKSPELWRTTVERMILRGAVLNETERETLIQYLAETYP